MISRVGASANVFRAVANLVVNGANHESQVRTVRGIPETVGKVAGLRMFGVDGQNGAIQRPGLDGTGQVGQSAVEELLPLNLQQRLALLGLLIGRDRAAGINRLRALT